MPVLVQIIIGSSVLIICALIHIRVVTGIVDQLRNAPRIAQQFSSRRHFLRLSLIFFVLLASHTVQVYIWAASLFFFGALKGYEAPIYFSLVENFRIFGAMASVNGSLTFGLSTAFLVGYFGRLVDGFARPR